MSLFRDNFHLPLCEKTEKPYTYLCGHSLGLQPKLTRSFVEAELEVWKTSAVEGHFKEGTHWYSYHETVAPSLATLTGSKPGEVVAMNSLTVNLHLMLVSFYRPSATRAKILADFPSFPSDKYALDSAIRFHGLDPKTHLIRFETFKNNALSTTEEWLDAIEKNKDTLALVYLNPVNYLTGQLIDVEPIARLCQQYDILIGLDLAHAIGNVTLLLNHWGIDFAIWCSYKYLNAGPGAIGGAFVHDRHHTAVLPRLEGWWGTNSKTRFQMADGFDSCHTVDAWQLSNPPILMLAALRASLEIFNQTSLQELRSLGDAMTIRFIDEITNSALRDEIQIINGTSPRGNMLCARLTNTSSDHIHRQLSQRGIILDQRKPDILRFSFCPLYNIMEDVDFLLEAFNDSLFENKRWGGIR